MPNPIMTRKLTGMGFFNSAGVPGITLPYTFTPPVSGAWPSPWVAPTWSGKVNVPTLGAELFTDPGLEGTYTDGLVAQLAKSGSPTLAQSADVHGGNKAQEFTGVTSNNALYKIVVPIANRFYQFSFWTKRTAGNNSTNIPQLSGGGGFIASTSFSDRITYAEYTQRTITKFINSTANLFAYLAYDIGISGFDTILYDDLSLSFIDTPSMFATVDAGDVAVTAKARWDWTKRNGLSGVISKADVGLNNFLVAYYFPIHQDYTYCVLDQWVNGVPTNLIAAWSNAGSPGSGNTPAATEWLEIRVDETNTFAQLFHNNTQVGTNKNIDAALLPNTRVGTFSSGGDSQLAEFFCG